jgi:flagellar FliL protein
MSEEAAAPEAKPATAAGPPKQKTSKAVLGLLVLNLAASGFITFRTVTAPAAAPAPAKEAAAVATTNEVTGPLVALEPFVVNLDEPGTSRYLKCTLQLELMPESEATIEKSKQLLRDAILSYLSGLHVKDTLGAEAKDHIRTDLLTKVTSLVGANKVRRLFFQEFVVQ